jgi:hypothetical protein
VAEVKVPERVLGETMPLLGADLVNLAVWNFPTALFTVVTDVAAMAFATGLLTARFANAFPPPDMFIALMT